MVGLITNVTAQALLRACEARGVTAADLLRDAGLQSSAVDTEEGRLVEADLHRLWRAAQFGTGDPDLAIHAAEAIPKGAYKVLDFMIAHAPSLGAGLERAARYFPLIHTGVQLKTTEGASECILDVSKNTSEEAARPSGEFTLAAFTIRARDSVEGELNLRRVECAYEEPEDRRELDRFFACPLVFASPSNRLVFTTEDWQRPTKQAEPGLFRILEEHAKRLEAELPADTTLATRVRRQLSAELRGGRPQAANIAKRLGMSERTLQRRLKAEHSGFAELLDATREELAKGYLKEEGLSQAEVAHLLGFYDVSAFHRAYRRWTGKTPGHRRS